MNPNRDTLVFLESKDGSLNRQSACLLGEGARLAQKLGGKLYVVFFGPSTESLARDVGVYGVEAVFQIKLNSAAYDPIGYEQSLLELLGKLRPGLFLAMVSTTSNDLLPRIAFKLQGYLVTNCAAVEVTTEGAFMLLKPVQDSRLCAHLRCPGNGLKLVTLLPEWLVEAEVSKVGSAEIVDVAFPSIHDRSIRVTGFIQADHRTIDLSEAQVIVAVGRGLGDRKQLVAIEALADGLRAAIGCTRPIVDMGILPYERQIGQTGKRVSPKLILFFGISGANEFTQGVKGDGKRIAINIDPYAPIFKAVDLGIVGDCRDLLPQLITFVNSLSDTVSPKNHVSAKSPIGGYDK